MCFIYPWEGAGLDKSNTHHQTFSQTIFIVPSAHLGIYNCFKKLGGEGATLALIRRIEARIIQLISFNEQIARAAIPSPLPINPMVSFVVPFIFTSENEMPKSKAIVFLILLKCGLILGCSATIVASILWTKNLLREINSLVFLTVDDCQHS